MPLPVPNPRAVLEVHIANRRAQLEEEIRHFSATAKEATVAGEKTEAFARVTVAQAMLKALEAL